MVNLEAISQIQTRIATIEKAYSPARGRGYSEFARALEQELKKTAVPAGLSVAKSKAVTTITKEETEHNIIEHTNANTNENENYSGVVELNKLIHGAANKYNIDPKLLFAVAEVESGNNQAAVSPVGAVGVMQLMPETAQELGVNPYDIKGNIEGGAKYLKQLLDSFDGDVKKALAAYNAGPNAVRNYGGIPPYSETQNYVNNVLDIYK